MKSFLTKSTFVPTLTVLIIVVISFGANALAFSEPSVAPPNDNAYAPLDTSGTANSKAGGLILNTGGAGTGLIVQYGNVILGGGSSSNWATVNIGGSNSIQTAGSIYSYSGICVGENSGHCTGSSGTVINGSGVRFPDGSLQTTASSGIAGPQGPAGPTGATGPQGPAGPGFSNGVSAGRSYSSINNDSGNGWPDYADSADSATYGRYVYNNGAYSGSGWMEPSSLGVYYAYLGRLVYNNGAYSGSGWTEPSDLGVRYANSAGSASSATYGRYVYNNGAYSGSGWTEPSDLGVRYANSASYANSAGYADTAGSAAYGGSNGGIYQVSNSGCNTNNPATGGPSCPAGYGAWLVYSAMTYNTCDGTWDQMWMYMCWR